jgi:MoaA/NifB/PqqE/SkfB family radical SAM enzyme
MNKITIEITNFCPNSCKYCSSNIVNDIKDATFLSVEKILEILIKIQKEKNIIMFEQIIISGGEPLSHPNFYQILSLLRLYTKDVLVYSNMITHICFNANVIDNIYVESNLTISSDVDKIHILKRIEQGKEKKRPEVVYSKNFTQECNCYELVILSNGEITDSPCKKENKK